MEQNLLADSAQCLNLSCHYYLCYSTLREGAIVPLSSRLAKQTTKIFLQQLRSWASAQRLQLSRLPQWITASKVRVGWINDALVSVFEDNLHADAYQVRGAVKSDVVVLLNINDFRPTGASLKARPDTTGLIILSGIYRDGQRTVFNLLGQAPAFFNCGYIGYFGPIALFNIIMQHKPDGADSDPVAARQIPFAIYAHERDVIDPRLLWSRCQMQLTNSLLDVHNSDAGDYYARLQSRATTFALNKRTGVIVLGKDTGPELEELIQVRDSLRGMGYDAELVKDLPEIPMMSNEEKVRLWTMVSRFAVIVDRVPAGQIAEYIMLREQRTIVALVRPIGAGSTYMIGDDSSVDVNFIRRFEFEYTPLSVLRAATDWAEGMVRERAAAYDKAYPWRDRRS